MERLIGQYSGTEKGILVIALAAMHGNEPAGVLALRDLFQMLEDERKKNPYFQFSGRLIGIIGNMQAYERKMRFVKKDLNRQLTRENIEKLKQPVVLMNSRYSPYDHAFEDLELLELTQLIENEIETYQPEKVIVLDLHTTSADGGIFTLVSEDPESLQISLTLHAPVVKGLIKGLGGSSLHYFNQENLGVSTVGLGFEAGQHHDVFSVRRTLAWVMSCLRTIGCLDPSDVASSHDEILRGCCKHLPKAVEIIYSHYILPNDRFKMLPDYQNFQKIKKGEILAYDKNGAINAPDNCRILMPLYQAQGNNGFFLVKEIRVLKSEI